MTQYPDLFAALAAPFEAQEVKTRNENGRTYHYITARTAMNRLDSELGPENWWDEYVPGENSVLCRLTIRLPDGQTLTKSDAGGYANMKDQGDDDKSGFSDAFKRTAVKFGVGRYLYNDGVPSFVRGPSSVVRGEEPMTTDHGPRTTDLSPPPVSRPEAVRHEPHGQRDQPYQGVPRTGKALFGWAKAQQEATGKDVVKFLQSWGKLQEYPQRMVEWNSDQVALGWEAACRKLATAVPANGAHG